MGFLRFLVPPRRPRLDQIVVDTSAPEFAPIAGVDLATYARLTSTVEFAGGGMADKGAVAASVGITPEDLDEAVQGWQARLRSNRSVAIALTKLYRGDRGGLTR